MDYMFRRWVRLPTVLALLKPKYGSNAVQVRFFTEDETTRRHYPWLEEKKTFLLYDTEYNPDGTMKNGELAKIAENLMGKNITIDRLYLDKVKRPYTTNCYLIEVTENKKRGGVKIYE